MSSLSHRHHYLSGRTFTPRISFQCSCHSQKKKGHHSLFHCLPPRCVQLTTDQTWSQERCRQEALSFHSLKSRHRMSKNKCKFLLHVRHHRGGSDSEAASGCENLRFSKTVRAAALGTAGAEDTYLQPSAVADNVRHSLCWIWVWTLIISKVPKAPLRVSVIEQHQNENFHWHHI